MFPRRKFSPWFRALAILVALVLVVVIVGRLDFPGWILRGLSSMIPAKQSAQYTPEEINALQAEKASLEQQNTYLNELVQELQRSAGMSEMSESIPYPLLNARVIYRDHARLFDTAIIDKGSFDGVEIDMPVVDSRGLVGRIVATTAAVSRVSLLTNPECSFGVIDQRSRDLGIVQGSEPVRWTPGSVDSESIPPDVLQLTYLSPSAQISVQDILITSGLSGITPAGLRVGEVVEIISREEQGTYSIRVRPFADFPHLENVAIVLFREENLADINRLMEEAGVPGSGSEPKPPE
jgi:rod shape-determining protein MreC